MSRAKIDILEALYPINIWPCNIPRPFARFQSDFEEQYRNINNIPWVITQPYALRNKPLLNECDKDI